MKKLTILAALAASLATVCFSGSVSAQGLEAPEAARFDSLPAFGQPATPVNPTATSNLRPGTVPSAQPGWVNPSLERIANQKTVAELRQERAMFQKQNRIARLERNAWLGHQALRPGTVSIPMMTSRYSSPRLIVVPAYVW